MRLAISTTARFLLIAVHVLAAVAARGAAAEGFTLRVGSAVADGELCVMDGDSGKQIALPGETGLSVRWETEQHGKWLFGRVELRNDRKSQAKLEVALKLACRRAAQRFFDGERVYPAKGERSADRLPGRFPLTCAWDGTACMALGYQPHQWLSYIRHSCKGDAERVLLQTATRIVVDPGDSSNVEFLMGAFSTKWGHWEALHWYYEAFPAFFRPRSDVDPRVNMNGGSYLAWTSRPDPELCRRLCVGWDWCYAPFKRTGDVYGRPEFWDYTPARPHTRTRKLPRQQYHEWRRKQFDNGKLCDVAMTCYIPSQIWCEEQLARQHYADALILDSRTKTYFETPWVTGPDNEMRVFPYKTSFGRQSLIDMAAMVRENNIQGFAFDVANGGAKYFGPHVNECPGRAWDDRGVYVDEGVAIAKLMDWCHAHADSSGRTLAVVSNPGDSPCYLTPFRSDSAMIEYDPLSVQRQAAPTLRNFLGHKTMVIWENYELEELLDYEHMSTEQMADALNGLTDYTIIASLRIAAVPTPRVCRGIRKLARWLPLLTEIALAGWQPVPAATCDCGLPMSRAGFGMRQFLMTGNETPHSASGAIAAENEWFGPGALLFMPEGATSAVNEFNGNATRVPFSLPSRGALVLRSVVSLDSAPDGLKASLHRLEDVDVTQITVELQSPTAWECRLMVPDWGRMRLERVELNGKPVAVRQTEGGWASERRITMSTHSVLAISCRSRALRLSEQELHEFPWVRDGQAGFEIVVAERAEPDVRYAAERLAAYFPYYFSIATDPPLKMAPARILHDQPNPALARVVMRTMPHAASRMDVSPGDGAGTLLITGRTPADVKAAVYELLAALDRRYACGGTLVGTPAIRATGLAGKELADEP